MDMYVDLPYSLNRAVVSVAPSVLSVATRKAFDARAEQTTPYTEVSSQNRRSRLDTTDNNVSWWQAGGRCGVSYAVMAPSRLSP